VSFDDGILAQQDATAARVVLDDVDELHQQQRLFRRLDAVLIQVLQQPITVTTS
jgi:hypothetical protein